MRKTIEHGAVRIEELTEYPDSDRLLPACNWYGTDMEPGYYRAEDGREFIVEPDIRSTDQNALFIV